MLENHGADHREICDTPCLPDTAPRERTSNIFSYLFTSNHIPGPDYRINEDQTRERRGNRKCCKCPIQDDESVHDYEEGNIAHAAHPPSE